MKTININSNITINWKIWRGVNKVEEDFVGSKLRVFLIGTENTYYLRPNAVGGVLTMTIAPGTLAAGSYDLKAIWEKNGGRTLMSSTRSNIFGITEAEEANPKDEVMNIVSYVESYGRDGLSAFEISVLRGLNRGCRSEAEWINSLYAGGEGGGGGICMLGTDIPIGGTELGDELLDNEEVKPYVSNNTLIKDTPLNVLFKALLYRAVEIQVPENVVASEGSVDITKYAELKVSKDYVGTRPNGYLLISVNYTPSEIALTPPEITGLRWGYKDEDGNIVKDEESVRGNRPDVTKRDEHKITVKVNGNEVEPTNGEYRYADIIKNNSDPYLYNISVTVDEGKVVYTTEELFVWPLNSAYNTYDDGILEPAKVNAEKELEKLEGSASYTHPAVGSPNPTVTNASASYGNANIQLSSTWPSELTVGQSVDLSLRVTEASLNKTNPQITGMTWGYKKDGAASDDNSISGTITETNLAPSSVKVYNNDAEAEYSAGKYTIKIVEGENKIKAVYKYPKVTCTAQAITVTPLNEDGYETLSKTANGMNSEVTKTDAEFVLKTVNAVLPSYIYTQKSDGSNKSDPQVIGYNKSKPENDQKNANFITTKPASTYNVIVLIPATMNNASIQVWEWNLMQGPSFTNWSELNAFQEDGTETDDKGVTYNRFKYGGTGMNAGSYFITINTY